MVCIFSVYVTRLVDTLALAVQIRSSQEHRAYLDTRETLHASDQTAIEHGDPFYCESWAYGRLKDVSREDLAVKACGYVMLQPAEEKLISANFDTSDWDRSHDEEKRQTPARAIVKEYVDSQNAFLPKIVPRMMRDLLALHKHGIQPREIRQANYFEGRIIDFSVARTAPYYRFDLMPKTEGRRMGLLELAGVFYGVGFLVQFSSVMVIHQCDWLAEARDEASHVAPKLLS
jgi:hypothetical protein